MTAEEHDEVATSALLARDLVMGYVVYNRSVSTSDVTVEWWTQCLWVRWRDPEAYFAWLTPVIEEAHIFDSVSTHLEQGLLVAETGDQSYYFTSSIFGYLPIYGCPKINGLAALADTLDAAHISIRVPRNP